MPRERVLQSFILKKQDYGETDQIITLFSKDEGKIRGIVKAAKLPTSKLQPVLQPLFESMVTIARSTAVTGLSKIIRAQPVFAYSGILEGSDKLSAWYMAAELLLRSLPDNAPNDLLYSEIQKYALFLHETKLEPEQVKLSIAQFQIKALEALGLGISKVKVPAQTPVSVQPPISAQPQQYWFSLDAGGFSSEEKSSDAISVTKSTYEMFISLKSGPYEEVLKLSSEVSATNTQAINNFQNLVNRFVSYQLEREIKSQRYLV